MARSKTVPAPPALDLPALPSDLEATEVATTETPAVLTSLIDKMREAEAEAKRKAEADWNSLVEKLAIDADVNEVEVLAAVQAAGKNLEDLAAAVDRQKEINRLKSVVAEFAEADHEHNRTWAALRAFRVREQETLKALRLESKQIRGEHFTADRRLNQVREAAEQLGRMGVVVNLSSPSSPTATMNADSDKASAVAELDHSVSAVA